MLSKLDYDLSWRCIEAVVGWYAIVISLALRLRTHRLFPCGRSAPGSCRHHQQHPAARADPFPALAAFREVPDEWWDLRDPLLRALWVGRPARAVSWCSLHRRAQGCWAAYKCHPAACKCHLVVPCNLHLVACRFLAACNCHLGNPRRLVQKKEVTCQNGSNDALIQRSERVIQRKEREKEGKNGRERYSSRFFARCLAVINTC